jgi:hypothetical protein
MADVCVEARAPMTRPYDEAAILPYDIVMANRPPITVDPATLHPTQRFAVIDRLVALNAGHPAEGPDPYPHVVDYDGTLYIHNGHHRWLLALMRDEPATVRIQKAKP